MNNTFIILLLVFVAGMMLTGCLGISSITPYDHGYAIGTAVYAGYQRIADKQSPEFREKVKAIWAEVNKIEDTEHLASDIAAAAEAFGIVVNDSNLTPAERETLRQLQRMVFEKVDDQLAAEALKHEDAIEFLDGVRSGINAMIAIEEEYK